MNENNVVNIALYGVCIHSRKFTGRMDLFSFRLVIFMTKIQLKYRNIIDEGQNYPKYKCNKLFNQLGQLIIDF